MKYLQIVDFERFNNCHYSKYVNLWEILEKYEFWIITTFSISKMGN